MQNLYVDSDYRYPVSYADGGHIVTVVGWDDNYSREHFTGKPRTCKIFYPDQPVDIPKPDSDGAFIVKIPGERPPGTAVISICPMRMPF